MVPSPRNEVVLVFPKTGQDVYGINVGLPLGVLSLATVLKQAGFGVRIVDERIVTDFHGALRRALSPATLFVGISAKTGYQLRGGLQAAAAVREFDPRIVLVWGGVHPTLVPETTIAHPLVDVIGLGEGEATIMDLAAGLQRGQSLSAIPGLIIKEDSRITRTAPRPLLRDLDELPPPDYGLIDIRDYITIGHILREPQLQLCTSRGCVHRCGYCYNLLFNHRQFRFMSASRTYAEICRLRDEFAVRSLFFYDDYFFGDNGRVQQLLELLEAGRPGMKFEVSCRVDFVDRAGGGLLERLEANGFAELLIGIESGNDEILRRIHKDFSVAQVLRANRKLARTGIHVKYSFMAGFPGETEAQILDTVTLMRRLLDDNPGASVTPLGIYTPYPGTEMFRQCLDQGLTNFPQTLEEWSDYNWIEARHSFLSARQMTFLNRLNVMSRFFDRRAFERFGNRFLRPLVMAFYWLYRACIALRLRFRFFALMPEVPLINRLQGIYVAKLHQRLLKSRSAWPRVPAGETKSVTGVEAPQ